MKLLGINLGSENVLDLVGIGDELERGNRIDIGHLGDIVTFRFDLQIRLYGAPCVPI